MEQFQNYLNRKEGCKTTSLQGVQNYLTTWQGVLKYLGMSRGSWNGSTACAKWALNMQVSMQG